jgi:hypothetical protein
MNPGIGDAGELWFASQLPSDWVWQPPRRDVGKDALIVVKDGSDLHNLEFSVQVKTTTRLQLDEKGTIRCGGIPTSSVLYWFASPQPTLVVVVDIDKKKGWYSWHLDLFASTDDISDKTTCSVRLPLSNALDPDGWARIRKRLRDHYDSLRNALHTARIASKIVPGIRAIAEATRDLIWLDREPERSSREEFLPSDHSAVFLLIHDQESYRAILDTVRSVLPLFELDTYTSRQIQLWLTAFQSHVLAAYPSFEALPRNAAEFPGVRITFNAPVLKAKRGLLVSAALDMITMLSGAGEPSNYHGPV